ncbi:hypothetical protein E4O00_04685 [Treponema sp. OMZ 788]|uniref:asparagine synthase-related protein n=1 Tax=Treponema sp. OMZ 788 TaxID=2563664 RepID=UPI0020A31D84|nr:asparagine synthase-related protein [Treponema sp. OMZ 788]UTC65420.1 hypothetical protein E4O00_04685 [Treponema sp. OMZ 788]
MKNENVGWFFVYFKSKIAANQFMLDDTLEVERNNCISSSLFLAYANFIKKFEKDHVYVDLQDRFCLQDGVVLNYSDNLTDRVTVPASSLFWTSFYGPFAGLQFDKKSRSIWVYTNQTGEKPVYYFDNKDFFMVSSSVYILSKILKKNGIRYSLNERTMNLLITYYHTVLDNTIISEVKRLRPGYYLVFQNNELQLEQYKVFKHNINPNISEDDAIEEIDRLFIRAVNYEFKKDQQYGYKHFVTLSGGLDSRMTCMVAHELGYSDILAFHFSNANYFEESIARKIATDLGIGYLYRSLNDHEVIYLLSEIIKLNYGNAVYSGIGGVFWAYKNLYTCDSPYGLVHTGEIGDAILGGSFFKYPILGVPNDERVESTIIRPILNDWSIYENDEQKDMYERAFCGCMSTHQITQHFTEEVSPFIEPDFMDFCFSLPIRMRYNSYIYKKWILKKHSSAAEYVWEKIGKKITDVNSVKVYTQRMKRYIKSSSYMQWLVKLYIKNKKLKEDMNPYSKWYLENNSLKKFIDEYYIGNIMKLDDYPNIKHDCEKVFLQGSGMEKLFVLTVLGIVDSYF